MNITFKPAFNDKFNLLYYIGGNSIENPKNVRTKKTEIYNKIKWLKNSKMSPFNIQYRLWIWITLRIQSNYFIRKSALSIISHVRHTNYDIVFHCFFFLLCLHRYNHIVDIMIKCVIFMRYELWLVANVISIGYHSYNTHVHRHTHTPSHIYMYLQTGKHIYRDEQQKHEP